MGRQSALESTLRDVDWAKCEIRHIKYRKTMNLGIARPLTVLRRILANILGLSVEDAVVLERFLHLDGAITWYIGILG
jgi:hypothetical protein